MATDGATSALSRKFAGVDDDAFIRMTHPQFMDMCRLVVGFFTHRPPLVPETLKSGGGLAGITLPTWERPDVNPIAFARVVEGWMWNKSIMDNYRRALLPTVHDILGEIGPFSGLRTVFSLELSRKEGAGGKIKVGDPEHMLNYARFATGCYGGGMGSGTDSIKAQMGLMNAVVDDPEKMEMLQAFALIMGMVDAIEYAHNALLECYSWDAKGMTSRKPSYSAKDLDPKVRDGGRTNSTWDNEALPYVGGDRHHKTHLGYVGVVHQAIAILSNYKVLRDDSRGRGDGISNKRLRREVFVPALPEIAENFLYGKESTKYRALYDAVYDKPLSATYFGFLQRIHRDACKLMGLEVATQ
jgi:hypothetical protein